MKEWGVSGSGPASALTAAISAGDDAAGVYVTVRVAFGAMSVSSTSAPATHGPQIRSEPVVVTLAALRYHVTVDHGSLSASAISFPVGSAAAVTSDGKMA